MFFIRQPKIGWSNSDLELLTRRGVLIFLTVLRSPSVAFILDDAISRLLSPGPTSYVLRSAATR